MIKKIRVLTAMAAVGLSGIAYSNDCFPPEVVPGRVLEGRQVTFLVKDVNKCWVKAVICTTPEKCRATPYWVHASTVEAFKADPNYGSNAKR